MKCSGLGKTIKIKIDSQLNHNQDIHAEQRDLFLHCCTKT
jgi:hypothetical protein